MTQQQLPLTDQPESQRERLLRILSGNVDGREGVARTFTPEAAREATALARGTHPPTTAPSIVCEEMSADSRYATLPGTPSEVPWPISSHPPALSRLET